MKLCMKFGSNLMKTVEGVVFPKSWNRKCCKLRRRTPNQTQGIGHQNTLHLCTVAPRVPNFRFFLALRSAVFEIFHILGLPLTPTLISKCHNFFFIFWQIAKMSITLYSTMTTVFVIKFGPDRMKTVGGVAFCHFQSHMVPC